jgi:hypothetical protein
MLGLKVGDVEWRSTEGGEVGDGYGRFIYYWLGYEIAFLPSVVLSLCVFRNNLGWPTRSLQFEISYQTAQF